MSVDNLLARELYLYLQEAIQHIGYDGCTCIEIEDKAFEDSKEKVEKSLILSKRYLEKYVI